MTHVTSLELSRRLKELGVPQRSIFARALDTGQVVGFPTKLAELGMYDEKYNWCSAYLASELGAFIGNSLENGEDKNIPKELQTTSIQDIWKPDFLAKLFIWLIENHLISVEELGKGV